MKALLQTGFSGWTPVPHGKRVSIIFINFVRPLIIFACLALLYFLSCFSVLYLVYKHHDYNLVGGDAFAYMAMAEKPFDNEVGNPFKYRLLTPVVVNVIARVGPTCDAAIRVSESSMDQHLLFWYCLVDFAFLCAAAALIALMALKHLRYPVWTAIVAGYLFMFAFPAVATAIMPSTDAGALFFITLACLALFARRPVIFALALVAGVLQKETVAVTVLGLLVIEQWKANRLLIPYFGALAVAVMVHVGIKVAMPSPGCEEYYQASTIFANLLSIVKPSTYSSTVLQHLLLSNVSLIAAVIAHGYLWAKKRGIPEFPARYLLLVPYLFVFGMCFVHPNNVMRVIFLSAPFTICYQVCILRGFVKEIATPDLRAVNRPDTATQL